MALQLQFVGAEQLVTGMHVALSKLEPSVCPNGQMVVFAKQLVQFREEQLEIGKHVAFRRSELRV